MTAASRTMAWIGHDFNDPSLVWGPVLSVIMQAVIGLRRTDG